MKEVTKTIRFTDPSGRTFEVKLTDGQCGAAITLMQPASGYGYSEQPPVAVGFEMSRAVAMDLVIALGPMIDPAARTTVLSQSESYLMAEIITLRKKLEELRAEVERCRPTWKAHT
jgi:hypothetical protein